MPASSFSFSEITFALLRVAAGLMMAFLHGWGKIKGAFGYILQGQEWGFIGGVASLGFPFPAFFALCAAFAEFVGGVLLAAGLFTRYAAAFVGITMGVAVYRHLTTDMRYELAAIYLFLALYFLSTGGKSLSLDHRLRPK